MKDNYAKAGIKSVYRNGKKHHDVPHLWCGLSVGFHLLNGKHKNWNIGSPTYAEMAETESEMQQFANDLETTTDELLDIYNKLTEWEIRFHWAYTIKDLDL